MSALPVGNINQRHDHLTEAHKGAIDAAGLLKEKQCRQQLLATAAAKVTNVSASVMRLNTWTKLHLESGAFRVCVFLPLRPGQIDQVQLRRSDVHHLVDGLFGLQSHGEHGVRSGRLAVHGGGGHSAITPAHRQHLRGFKHKFCTLLPLYIL